MKPLIGILLGEASGIGPELVAKMCGQNKLSAYCRPLVIGDIRILEWGKKIAGVQFKTRVVKDIRDVKDVSYDGREEVYPVLDRGDLDPADVRLGEIDRNSGKATGDMVIKALELCRDGVIDGFTYAPLNKAALRYSGYDFKDEHRLMAHYLKWDGIYGEMNVVEGLWTTRVTSHVPIKDVASSLSVEKILKAVRLADGALRRAGTASPRIAVAALNPHAGEDGLCGREEIDIIAPAVKAAKDMGINASGPYPADTVFVNAFRGAYDAVATMYHDQGQIALKLFSSQRAVTVAAGFPYPITTPAHGTAFDIAGKGTAKTDSMEMAVAIASRMAAAGKPD